jgi:hypothetical protein
MLDTKYSITFEQKFSIKNVSKNKELQKVDNELFNKLVTVSNTIESDDIDKCILSFDTQKKHLTDIHILLLKEWLEIKGLW